MTTKRMDLDAFREELVRRGFLHGPVDGTYRRAPHEITVEDGWIVVRNHTDGEEHPALGSPGLWRGVEERGRPARLFELSPLLFELGTSRDLSWSAARFNALLSWALNTSGGEVPTGWEAPSEEQLAEWIPAEQLTVRSRGALRQGRLVREANRLALQFPIVAHLSPDLPASRGVWLRALLADAQQKWRTVRIATDGEEGAQAEIDLTGAPPEVQELLCRIAIDTLRWVVGWLVPAATFLADASAECRALEILSPQGGVVRPQPGGAR